jgi:CBS domain-containing protein
VRSITLFLFGGVTESSFRFRTPGDELVMVAAGPATSFALAAVFGVVAWWAGAVGVAVVAVVTGTLAWLNLALGLFNLVPGAPLDGGRILQALIWRATGDRRRSMEVAGNVGRAIAGLLIGGGLALFLLVPGGGIDGAWLALIGWFLYRSAGAEIAFVRLEATLAELRVDRLVPDGPGPLPPSASVHDAELALVGARTDDVLAIAEHGRVVGIVEVERLRAVPTHQRTLVRIGAVSVPADGLVRVDGGADATGLLELPPDEPVVVVGDGHDLGAVVPSRAIGIARRVSSLAAR